MAWDPRCQGWGHAAARMRYRRYDNALCQQVLRARVIVGLSIFGLGGLCLLVDYLLGFF